MALPFCNDIYPGYCDNEKPMIDSACHEEGKEAGRHIMFQPDPTRKTTCWCICSCLGAGTPIMLGDGSQAPVEALQPRQSQVLAAGKGLQFTPHVVSQVSAAAPGVTDNTLYLRYHLDGQPRELVITMDHPVYVQTEGGERRIVAAASLQMNDRLFDVHGNLVAIDELHWGSYDASFWELATSMEPPDADLNGHLLVTAGIVTGDFAVATFVDYPFGLGSLDVIGDPERPHIGTSAWRRANATAAEAEHVIEVHGAEFKPAALHRVEVPAHASAFLPASQAGQLEEDEDVPKRPISDEYYLEECQWLIQKCFKPLFPDITFLFDWYSDEVNSWSWVDQEDESAKFVLLSGGLSRIVGFDYEGVALALAHEVGHLKGRPVVRGGVTCEGEADFYGALNVMRMLWFGEYYFEYTTRAVDQLRTLYRYLDGPVPPESEAMTDSFGAAYPSNDCRIETIEKAMASPKIPACAECVPPPEAD